MCACGGKLSSIALLRRGPEGKSNIRCCCSLPTPRGIWMYGWRAEPAASSKYPPAEPGALGIGPLKAAGLDPKLHLCGPRRKHFLEIPTRYPIFSATVGEQIPLDILRPHLARF